MPKTILIVDDEADFVELVRYRFEDTDFQFEHAPRGMDALNKVSLAKPDAILLDVLLPDLDGLTLCEILNRQPGTRRLPVILVSALDTTDTRAAGRNAGAHSFVSKPVDFPQLRRLLDSVFGNVGKEVSPTGELESVCG